MNSSKRENNNNEEIFIKEQDIDIQADSIDLNLDNYDFKEMTNIFNISPNLNYEDNSNLFNTLQEINLNSHNFSQQFINLLRKIFVILNVVSKYKEFKQVNDNNYIFNEVNADEVIIQIKNIENFEHINPKNIIQIILSNENFKNKNNFPNLEIDNRLNGREKINLLNDTEEYNKLMEAVQNKIYNNFDNPIVPGTINSIKRITKTTNLHINSQFRNNYYKSNPNNFSYNLPKIFNNVVSINLNSIELKNTWLLINERNNFFYIKKDGIITKIELDIMAANNNLLSAINDKLTNFNNNNSILITILFNQISDNSYTTFNISNLAIDKTIDIIFYQDNDNTNLLNSLGWILGFRSASYNNISPNTTLNSETFVNFYPIDTIYLSINDYQYNYNETNIICFDKTSLDDHILSKFSINKNNNLYINLNENERNLTTKRSYNGPINLSKIEVKLYDKFGNLLDNKNADYSFSLQLEILYENNNVKQLVI